MAETCRQRSHPTPETNTILKRWRKEKNQISNIGGSDSASVFTSAPSKCTIECLLGDGKHLGILLP